MPFRPSRGPGPENAGPIERMGSRGTGFPRVTTGAFPWALNSPTPKTAAHRRRPMRPSYRALIAEEGPISCDILRIRTDD